MYLKLFSIFLLLIGFQAQAAILTFSDRTAFQAAAGAALTLEEFDDLSLAAGVSLATGGGTVIPSNSGNCPDVINNPCVGLIETASLTLTFSPGVTAVGFDYNELNTTSLDYVDSAGNTINAALTPNVLAAGWIPKFFGVISDVSLDSLTIGAGTDNGGAVYFIDNLAFGGTVPEPSILGLMAAGIIGWGFTRRRRLKA